MLGLAIADELARRFPDAPEGRLAPLKAHAISGASCARVGRQLGLDRRFAAVAEAAGAAPEIGASTRVLAAVTEAAIGAVFLAHGWDAARSAVDGGLRRRCSPTSSGTPWTRRRSCRRCCNVRAAS